MDRILAESRAAIGLLTRIPVAFVPIDRPGAAAFGLVGAALAALAAIPYLALSGPAGEPVLGAIAAVAVLVVLTGGLHLDGLADTADALAARDRSEAERARRDPAVGPAGLATVVLTLGAEVAALTSLASTVSALSAGATLVAAGGIARTVPVILVRLAGPSGSAGLGAWFARHVGQLAIAAAVLTAVGLVAMLAVVSGALALAVLVGAIVGIGTAWAMASRRGGLDGDSLGAAVELTFAAILVAVAVLVD